MTEILWIAATALATSGVSDSSSLPSAQGAGPADAPYVNA